MSPLLTTRCGLLNQQQLDLQREPLQAVGYPETQDSTDSFENWEKVVEAEQRAPSSSTPNLLHASLMAACEGKAFWRVLMLSIGAPKDGAEPPLHGGESPSASLANACRSVRSVQTKDLTDGGSGHKNFFK
ncbi:hypothetical protein NHX12_028139 [Muraenolepis orangiensis]|uniref:Uncharacterized protein n=1 Tax=Muraenolepis orangiensis TaxID=630683 RepID=A0A9Q0EG09_9TELE|nr:hypothetical protein NHX12_028139 [Muraenolepis orangiensis]